MLRASVCVFPRSTRHTTLKSQRAALFTSTFLYFLSICLCCLQPTSGSDKLETRDGVCETNVVTLESYWANRVRGGKRKDERKGGGRLKIDAREVEKKGTFRGSERMRRWRGTPRLLIKCGGLSDLWPVLVLWVVVNHSVWPRRNVSHQLSLLSPPAPFPSLMFGNEALVASLFKNFFFFKPNTLSSSPSASLCPLILKKKKPACQTTMIPRSASSPSWQFLTTNKLLKCGFCRPAVKMTSLIYVIVARLKCER